MRLNKSLPSPSLGTTIFYTKPLHPTENVQRKVVLATVTPRTRAGTRADDHQSTSPPPRTGSTTYGGIRKPSLYYCLVSRADATTTPSTSIPDSAIHRVTQQQQLHNSQKQQSVFHQQAAQQINLQLQKQQLILAHNELAAQQHCCCAASSFCAGYLVIIIHYVLGMQEVF